MPEPTATPQSAEYDLTCRDHRPVDLHAPHGVRHFQVRLPLAPRLHLCATLTSGRYFVPMVERYPGMARVALPFAALALVRRSARPQASYMRWCAHINVTAESHYRPGRATTNEGDQ